MENRDQIESTLFEEKTFNNRIVDSSTFDIVTSLENNQKKLEPSLESNNIKNYSKFIEMPLQLNSSMNRSKARSPFLSVEDKGYTKQNYRNYEISVIDEKNEKKVKCYRRFSNFNLLDLKLREKYPYFIIPSLLRKDFKNNFIELGEEFHLKRTKRIRSYINYIFKHEFMKNSLEMQKFLNDADFVTILLNFRMNISSLLKPKSRNSQKAKNRLIHRFLVKLWAFLPEGF